MTNNKFKYAIIDLSMLLYRNSWVVSKDKEPGQYTAGEIIQMTIWSLNKFARDYGINADKFVFAVDKWNPEWNGYYTTYLLGGAYKDSRGDIESAKGKADPLSTYMTREKFEELKKDPSITPDILKEAEKKLFFNETKQKAKFALMYELGNFGVPSIYLPGYEADNLMYLASMLLYDPDPASKPSVLITKDSDVSYCTSPKMLQFKMPVGKSQPEFITYEKMYSEMPDDIKDLGLSLYQYKSFLDSLGAEGHNGMRRTAKDRVNPVEAIKRIMKGDFSDLNDVDLFKRQMETFSIEKYPRFEEARRQITDILPNAGKLGTLEDFHKFCDKYGITKISDRYYVEFISRFDPTLYNER
jgi:hypothetical protein